MARKVYVSVSSLGDDYVGSPGYFFDAEAEPSLTIPDHAMSLEEILTRFQRGGEIRVLKPQNPEHYEDETQMFSSVDLSKLDKVQRMELLDEVKTKVRGFQTALAKGKEAKAKKDAEKAKKDAEKSKDNPLKEEGETGV